MNEQWTVQRTWIDEYGVMHVESAVLSSAALRALGDIAARPYDGGQVQHLIEAVLCDEPGIAPQERALLVRLLNG